LAQRLKQNNVLMKIDALMMLKAILLGQWHSLSDTALEQALCVRIKLSQQRQPAVFEKAQNQERDHAPDIQEQTTLGTIKVNALVVLRNICMNLKKLPTKLSRLCRDFQIQRLICPQFLWISLCTT